MVDYFGPRTSRVLDLDAKSLQLLIARSGKAITDAEGIFIQDLQARKLSEVTRTQTFSGCVDLPSFSVSTSEKNCLVIPSFRALIGSDLLVVQGTQNPDSPSDLSNYVYLPSCPSTGYGIVVVYLEAWYQILDEVLGDTAPFPGATNQGFWPNYYASTWDPKTNPRYYYPYGNSLAHTNWIQLPQFLDDLSDSTAGYTSARVQLQYAIRATQVLPGSVPTMTSYLGDFGMTHPSLGGMTWQPLSAKTPFVYRGSTDPGLYVSTNSKLRNVDGKTYAIPLAIIYQRNSSVWDPTNNPHGTAYALSPSTVSGRPDGKFSGILYAQDILDTRSSYLGGSMEDYESIVAQTASRLWKGALRLKLAEPTSTDTNSHQLGQMLLSQEFLGPNITSPFVVAAPIASVSTNSVPQLSWTSDLSNDTITYMLTPSNSTSSTLWAAGDVINVTHPNTSTVFASATLFTYNSSSQIFIIPPAYISVSNLGTNSITLQIYNISVDSRFDLSNPIWVTLSMRTPKSINHFRYVPSTLYPPILMDSTLNGASLPCGCVSDFSMGYEDTSIYSTYPIRTYKRNYDPNVFGTVRKLKIFAQDFTQHLATDVSGVTGALSVIFTSVSQTVSTKTVLLSWNVSNATRATLTNTTTGVSLGDVPLVGTMSVRITQTCVFTLTAYNDTLGTSTTSLVTVNPPTDLVGGSSASDTSLTSVYAAPGGSLNPENTLVSYSTVSISSAPGFGGLLNNVMLGCVKATMYVINQSGTYDTTDLQIRHQYFNDNSGNDGLGSSEIGFFGEFEANSTDYVELEMLVTELKTFHYNPTVQGITAVTETVAPSLNEHLYFSTGNNETYTLADYPDYPNATMNIIVSVPTDTWDTYQVGGVFEGMFGFNEQGYCFIKQSTDTFYRTTPCTYSGLGTPLLVITLPQVTLASIDDILVLAQATTTISNTSTVMFNYDYIPYQGEGDASDSYSLTYLNPEAQVTTFGTGSRSIPGLTSTAATNPEFPVSSAIPAMSGWSDADLESAKFTINGTFSGTSNPAYSNTDFLSTKVMSTVSGNIRNLLDISGSSYPSLSPRGATTRGFSSNIIAFSYIVDSPKIVASEHTLNSVTTSDLSYWIDPTSGLDTNSGLTRESPKQSLQTLLNSLPETIKHVITIYVNGTTTLSDSTQATLNITQAVPYGSPDETSIYSLIKTSFNTIGDGKVVISRDLTLSSTAYLNAIPNSNITDLTIYGWLHLGGRLHLEGIIFTAVSGVSFAAYPGSNVTLNNCGFTGGAIQLLGYNSDLNLTSTSFTNATEYNIIASNGTHITLNDGITFNKGAATGYTVVAEKSSSVTILTNSFACSAFPTIPQVEFFINAYSTIDTHLYPNFTFPLGKLQLSDFSTQILPNSTAKPFVVVGSPASSSSDTFNQVIISA